MFSFQKSDVIFRSASTSIYTKLGLFVLSNLYKLIPNLHFSRVNSFYFPPSLLFQSPEHFLKTYLIYI